MPIFGESTEFTESTESTFVIAGDLGTKRTKLGPASVQRSRKSTPRAASGMEVLNRLPKSDAGRREFLAQSHPSKLRGRFQQLFLATLVNAPMA